MGHEPDALGPARLRRPLASWDGVTALECGFTRKSLQLPLNAGKAAVQEVASREEDVKGKK